MNRKDIIQQIFIKKNFKNYLELGLLDKNNVFNHIPAESKHSVDINLDFATYKMSTDNFFQKLNNNLLDLPNDYKWDLVFIDANHLANFILNDIDNSIKHLNDDGLIILHDTLPPNYNSQLEDRICQTAWKVVPFILKYRTDLHICSVYEDTGGLSIIRKNLNGSRNLLNQFYNVFFEYYIFNDDRKISQNIIDYNILDEWLENPFYNFENSDIIINLEKFSDPYKIQHIWKS